MGRVTLTLPRLGETMEEAKVTEWIVTPGAAYARGDVLLEVETDKTVVEVPALVAGTLLTQLVAPGDTVNLEAPIAEVEQEGESPSPEPEPEPTRTAAPAKTEVPKSTSATPRPAGHRLPASPAARAEAHRRGVTLTGITGTGRRGRITADDVAGGDGTIVLLHGLFDDSTCWGGLPQRLARRGLTCIALDLPGHGGDTSPAEDFDQAIALLAHRLPGGPLHLVGHSLGAAFAARLATQTGSRVQSLTLFAPAGLGPTISAEFLDGMAHANTADDLKATLPLLDGGPVSDVAIAQQLSNHLRGLPARIRLAETIAKNGIQQIDVTADIAAAPCPVTVIFGTADRILNWRDVAHLPAETRIHLIPNAGHLPHRVRPDLAAALIASRHVAAEIA